MSGPQQPSPTVPVTPSVLVASGDPAITELRLALVCFGGVSLAIYMHGVTKEIQSLLVASRAFDAAWAVTAPDAAPVPGPEVTGTARAYFDQLVELARVGAGVTASVDIVAGTSAGGINGVCLAQAAVCGSSQDQLTELWMDKGDMSQLLRFGFLGQHLGEAVTALALPFRARSDWSPLKGDDMSRWLYQALDGMERPPAGAASLLPDGGTMDLFVTTTDLHGTDAVIPLGTGGALHDRTYHRVFGFHYEPTAGPEPDATARIGINTVPGTMPNTLGSGMAWPLAYAARATSCFPGAFPPVSPAEFSDAVGELADGSFTAQRFADTFMPDSDAAIDGDPTKTYMMDGGVLDNQPFDAVVEAIAGKPAGREVTRHLVFIEPDPGGASPGTTISDLKVAEQDQPDPDDEPPTWLAGVWAALSTIPHHQPLLGAAQSLADLNAKVASIGQIIAALTDDVGAHLATLLDPAQAVSLTAEELREHAAQIYAAVPETVGSLNFRTYGRLKMTAIADRLALDLGRHLDYRDSSGRAAFIRAVLRAWVQELPEWRTSDDAAVQRWLGPLDIPYRDRRLQFIIAGINGLFARATSVRVAEGPVRPAAADTPDPAALPSRAQLAEAKRIAWTILLDQSGKPRVAVESMAADVAALLGPAALSDTAILTDPVQWERDHRDAITGLVGGYRSRIDNLTASSAADLWTAFTAVTMQWPGPSRAEVASRFVGFPIWDALLFPVQAVSDLPAYNRIRASRFSPQDAHTLTPPHAKSGKLLGVSTHHFGAFFALDRRQNDYLWGRLDGVELILNLLAQHYDSVRATGAADLQHQDTIRSAGFAAVLDGERDRLPDARDLIDALTEQVRDGR